MTSFFNSKSYIVFALLFVISVAPFAGRISKKQSIENPNKELFKPELVRINSISKAVVYIDSVYLAENPIGFDTLEYVKIATRFTKERFYHGLSLYTFSENWIANLTGKYLWTHLSAIVDADDILKHADGLCSQQTIVFMELLKRKKIHTRSVGLGFKQGPGHFLSEVHYDQSWHLFDVTVEPIWRKIINSHKSMDYYLQHKDSLYLAYEFKYDRPLFDKLLEQVVYGNIDDFPAKNMRIFHQITLLVTYLLPLFFLVMFFITFFNTKKSKQKFLSKPVEDNVKII